MNIFRMAAALMALVLTASCLKVDIIRPTVEEGQVSLTIKCSDIAQTRATEAGEDAYNENKIDRLDVFFYAAGASDDAAAIYRMTLTSLNATGSYTYDQRIETTIIETIFGTGANAGTQAKIYAIANLPAGITLSDAASVNELKATAIETAALAGTVKQDNFVMDSTGDDVVTYDSATRGITGEIKLYRAASKIALFITEVSTVPVTDADGNVQKDAQGNDIMWTANTNDMMVRLNNGVKKTHLDNTVSPYTVVTDDYFSFTKGMDRKLVADGSQWKQELPFYSYSSDWSADGKDQEAYLTLIVPWQKSDAPGVYHPTYYQVPINGLTEDLIRNNYYKISLKVSRLGAFTEGDAVTITPGTYIILNWTTNTIDADMLDYRYLVVDQKEYTIYNQEELYIPFASSHETKITKIEYYKQDISKANPVWVENSSYETLTTTTVTDAEGKEKDFIYYKNILDNKYNSSTFDFTPYKAVVTIQHSDNPDYTETVTIIQYPAIYGVASQNSDYVKDENGDNVDGDGNNANGGYMFVNGYNDAAQKKPSNSATQFLSTPGLSEDWASPNMYVFNISSVSGTDFVIGDPREESVTYDGSDRLNNSTVTWANAPVLYNSKVYSSTSGDISAPRTLKNYYATENSTRTENMIAPKFRIASGYAVLVAGNNNSKYLETLRMRCASYQEDGYPAGRWRLPTKAEMEFILYQTNAGRLPDIYKDNTTYWCAHGSATVSGTQVNLNRVTEVERGYSARCVYDEWYWKDKLSDEDKDTFTWGDMPR